MDEINTIKCFVENAVSRNHDSSRFVLFREDRLESLRNTFATKHVCGFETITVLGRQFYVVVEDGCVCLSKKQEGERRDVAAWWRANMKQTANTDCKNSNGLKYKPVSNLD